MINRYIFSTYLFICFTSICVSQVTNEDPFEQMNKRYQEKMQKMEADYAQKAEQMQKDYEQRLKKMNAAFEKYLKQDFLLVEQKEEEIKKEEVPKPIDQPAYEPIKTAKVESKLADIPEPVAPDIILKDAPAYSIAPITMVAEDASVYKENININFFGTSTSLAIDKRMKNLHLGSVTPNSFAKYWNDFCKTYYSIYIESVLDYAQDKNLNDWGIYQLLDITATKIFSTANDREMWKWAMLNQSGYNAKIGYNGHLVCIMVPFMQEVYEKPYYAIGEYNYYLLDNRLGQKNIYTYTEDFSGATKMIDLHLPYALNFNSEENSITKQTKLPGEKLATSIKLDKTIIAFLSSYPQTENTVYLNAAMSPSVKGTLYEEVKPHLVGLSETESVSYILDYLHHSFGYKTDREQFGKEKMFFPDEMFYYPYNDCEDRTVLFTRMVNDLLGLDVVALTYFSHMAAAIHFNTDIDGYSFLVDGKKYTICDPTYIDAPIGSVMPDYRDYTPIAIKINNNNEMSNIWQMIAKTMENGNDGNIFISNRLISENGKYIVSGWFKNNIKIGDQHFMASNQTRDLWYATFNSAGEMEWFLPMSCSGTGYNQAFNVGKTGNIYALLDYSGTIAIDKRTLGKADNESQMILGISNKARPILNESLNFEVPEGKKLAFYAKYKANGTKVDMVSFPTDEVRFDSKITVDSQNDIVVRGIVGKVEGLTMDVPINLTMEKYSTEDQLESFITSFQQQEFNKKIAPLFAALEVLSQNGGSISGLNIRNLIRKNNPDFSKLNPEIYEGLLRMQFVINEGGVINVKTYKSQNVSLFSMRIQNNTNLQIIKNDKNDYSLKLMNGVDVGKAFIWYKLNNITLKSSGDMTFDYDDDHTKKMVSIEDIVN